MKGIYEALNTKEAQLILFVAEADGSEEIPKNVFGVVLQHPIPQLSHLAIRSRQANIAFVCCNNKVEFEKL